MRGAKCFQCDGYLALGLAACCNIQGVTVEGKDILDGGGCRRGRLVMGGGLARVHFGYH